MMQFVAAIVAFLTRVLTHLIGGGDAAGHRVALQRRPVPVGGEPGFWEKFAAGLGWVSMHPRQVPVYVRRTPADTGPQQDHHFPLR